jgi:hypothetical protein
MSIMPLSFAMDQAQDGGVNDATFAPEMPARTAAGALLLIERDDDHRLTLRRNSPWVRVVGRLFPSTLDRQLAQGRSPESGLLLATRAQLLTARGTRRALAHSWENLLQQAGRPAGLRDPRAPVNREEVAACEPEIHALIGALRGPLPVPARGAAMASRLLSDGTGPVYNPHRAGQLQSALRDAIAQLDPAAPL